MCVCVASWTPSSLGKQLRGVSASLALCVHSFSHVQICLPLLVGIYGITLYTAYIPSEFCDNIHVVDRSILCVRIFINFTAVLCQRLLHHTQPLNR